MVRTTEIEQKVEIAYPCQWQFKLIGMDQEAIHTTVIKTVAHRTFTITPSRTSSGGKFVSLNLVVLIQSEEERLGLYAQLKACDHILYIL